jgi:hypothetical protein
MITRAWAGTVLYLVAVGPVGADDLKNQDEFRAADESNKILVGTWSTNTLLYSGWGTRVVVAGGGKRVICELVLDEDGRMTERGMNPLGAGKTFQVRRTNLEEGEVDIDYGEGKLAKGIFHLKGEDHLTLCLAEPGADRPTEYEVRHEGPIWLLIELGRRKP